MVLRASAQRHQHLLLCHHNLSQSVKKHFLAKEYEITLDRLILELVVKVRPPRHRLTTYRGYGSEVYESWIQDIDLVLILVLTLELLEIRRR